MRQDGAFQWALDGRPLHFSARDRIGGDAFDHGFRDVRDVVKVTGSAAQTAIAPLPGAVAPIAKTAAPAHVEPTYAAPVYASVPTYDTYTAPSAGGYREHPAPGRSGAGASRFPAMAEEAGHPPSAFPRIGP